MKFLVSIKPSAGFSWLMSSYRSQELGEAILKTPGSGDHCTLMVLRANDYRENDIINSLGAIDHPVFDAVPEDMDLFDEGSLVIRLEKTRLLQGLHEQVIQAVQPYIDWANTPPLEMPHAADPERLRVYRSYGSPYFEQYYSPHLTLAQVDPEKFDMNSLDRTEFSGLAWEVDRFYLKQKEKDGWHDVKEFSLRPQRNQG